MGRRAVVGNHNLLAVVAALLVVVGSLLAWSTGQPVGHGPRGRLPPDVSVTGRTAPQLARLYPAGAGGWAALTGTLFTVAAVIGLGLLLRRREELQRVVAERTAALQQERVRLSSIIRGTNVGTWEWHIPTGATVFNPRWAEIIGYTLEELSPVTIDTWLKHAHPDDLEVSRQRLARHFRGELEYYEHECRMKHKDGRWVWVLDRGCVTSWTADGQPLLMYSSHQDITDRKQAEEALKESDRVQRLLLENIEAGVVVIDPHTELIEQANRTAARLLGAPADQISGCPSHCFALSEPDSDRGDRGPEVENVDRLLQRADGQPIPVMKSVRRVQLHGHDKLVVTFVDITRRKRAEAEVLESRERFAQIATLSGELIWEVNARGLFTYVSQTCNSLLGYREDELVGKRHFYDLHPDQGRDGFRRRVFAVFGRREPFLNVHHQVVAKDGRVLDLFTNGLPIVDRDGQLVGYRGAHHDVTEQRRMEAQLQNSLRELEDLTSNIPKGSLWKTDLAPDGSFSNTYFSLASDQLLELPTGTLQHDFQKFFTHLLPPYLPLVLQRLSALCAAPGSTDEMEYQVRKGNGELAWFFSRASSRLVDGTVRVTGYTTDITERKRFDEALRASEKNFRTCFESADEMIAVAARDGRMLYGNPALLDRLGYTSQELQAIHVSALHPDDASQEATEIFGAMVRGQRSTCPLPWRTKRGDLIPAETRAWLGRWNGEDCVFAIIKDLGAEQEAQQRFERLFRCNPALMAISALPERTFVDVNDAFLARTGYTREEVVGQSANQLGLFLDPQEQADIAHQLRSSGRLTEMEVHIRRKDGAVLHGLFSGEVVSSQGQRYLLTVMIDVSAQERAQRELKETVAALESANKALEQVNQIAESATRAKSEFLANMSHEIRTPMTAILGFAEMLLGEEGIDQAPRERVEAIRTIQRNGRYLLELINDILDLSKIEARKVEVERIACSPIQVLSDVITLMRIRAEAKNLPLVLEFAGALPQSIRSDPLRLRQILINLVGNAIKFTETGSVRVVARLVQRHGRPPLLRVDVIDTGVGVSPAQFNRLFQPFNQADSSTARKFGGTGLGLTISKRLAEMLGGGITVRSAPGRGSTFSVTVDAGDLRTVPLVAPRVARAAAPAPPNGPTVRLDCRILLAEDGPDNQRLIAFLLRRAGAQVSLAENGQVACQAALAARDQGCPFDIILMDMQMPNLDGYEATRRLRAAGLGGPIVALTAHAMDGDREKCLDAGCNDYATKPVDQHQLLRTVAHWVSAARQCPSPTSPS